MNRQIGHFFGNTARRRGLSDAGYLLLIFLFLFLFWSPFVRMFSPMEMWFLCMADKMSGSEVLYRDIFCPIPPAYPLAWAGLSKVFGHALFWYRIYGVVEKMCFVWLTFLLFRSVACRRISFVLTIISVMLFSNSFQDVFTSYYQFALIPVFAAVLLQMRGVLKERVVCFFWAGVLYALAIFVKQTIGVFAAACGLCIIPLLRNKMSDRWLRMWGACFLGFCGAFASAVLCCHKVFGISFFLRDVFGIGQKNLSKGDSLADILFGFIERMPVAYYVTFAIILGFLTAGGLLRRRGILNFKKFFPNGIVASFFATVSRKAVPIFIVFSLSALAAAFLFCGHKSASLLLEVNVTVFAKYTVHLTFLLLLVIDCVLTFECLAGRGCRNRAYFVRVVLLCAISTGIAWSHGLSGVLEEHCLVPAWGCVVLLAARHWLRISSRGILILLTAVGIPMVALFAHKHYARSYDWWGWHSLPVTKLMHPVSVSELAGYRFSEHDRHVFEETVRVIKTHSRKNEPIYTYPHIPVFHVLSNRPLPWRAVTHYFDFCPDWIIDEYDLPALNRIEPPVIVWMQFPEDAVVLHEKFFRGGKKSAQRRLQDWLDRKVAQGAYEKAAVFEVSESFYFPIAIYVKGVKNAAAVPGRN